MQQAERKYTLNDIVKRSGSNYNTVRYAINNHPALSGKKEKSRYSFTKAEFEECVNLIESRRPTREEAEGLETGALMSQTQVARFLKVSPCTLAAFQKTEDAMPFVEKGNIHIYKKSDVVDFKKSGVRVYDPNFSEKHTERKKQTRKRVTSSPKNDAPIRPIVKKGICSCCRTNKIKKGNRFLCVSCMKKENDVVWSRPVRSGGLRSES